MPARNLPVRQIGFTLTELLVSLAVTGLLLALILPAVQAAREAARRTQCRSNLHQIGLALANYESLHGMWPAGSFEALTSWEVAILPEIGESALFQQVDFQQGYFSTSGTVYPTAAIAHVPIRLYLCPSDSAPEVSSTAPPVAATNYVGNSGTGLLANTYGYDGMFGHDYEWNPRYADGRVRLATVTDGLSTTAAVAEILHSVINKSDDRLRVVWNTPVQYSESEINQFRTACAGVPHDPISAGWHGNSTAHGWEWVRGELGWSMYNHMLPPMQPSCFDQTSVQHGIYSAASAHQAMTNVLFADGHVQAISAAIDARIWAGLGSRNGSEPIQP